MKFILTAVLCCAALTACDKPETSSPTVAKAPPKPEQRLKPVSTAPPAPENKPEPGTPAPAPEIVVEKPATPEEISSYYTALDALQAQAQPILDAAAANNPDAVSDETIKAAREALQSLMKQRGQLTPGLTLEQRKELARRSAPLVPKLTGAITKLQITRTTRNARQHLTPEGALPAAPGGAEEGTVPQPAAEPAPPAGQ